MSIEMEDCERLNKVFSGEIMLRSAIHTLPESFPITPQIRCPPKRDHLGQSHQGHRKMLVAHDQQSGGPQIHSYTSNVQHCFWAKHSIHSLLGCLNSIKQGILMFCCSFISHFSVQVLYIGCYTNEIRCVYVLHNYRYNVCRRL